MSINKIAGHYYDLGKRHALIKLAAGNGNAAMLHKLYVATPELGPEIVGGRDITDDMPSLWDQINEIEPFESFKYPSDKAEDMLPSMQQINEMEALKGFKNLADSEAEGIANLVGLQDEIQIGAVPMVAPTLKAPIALSDLKDVEWRIGFKDESPYFARLNPISQGLRKRIKAYESPVRAKGIPKRTVWRAEEAIPASAPTALQEIIDAVPPAAPTSLQAAISAVPPAAPTSLQAAISAVPPAAPTSLQAAISAVPPAAPTSLQAAIGTVSPAAPTSLIGADSATQSILSRLKSKGLSALDYARTNPGTTALGALGLAGGAYGAKKLYDYLTHEEEPTTQEKMLALAKQYGPQAAAALAATGALYGGYRAMRSSDRD